MYRCLKQNKSRIGTQAYEQSFSVGVFAVLILVFCGLLLFLSGCSKNKERAPFFDGLYLEYGEKGRSQQIYAISSEKEGFFKVMETEKSDVFSDKEQEYLVDSYGIVRKSSHNGRKGKYTSIWVPPGQLKVGDRYKDGVVSMIKQWKKWEVIVIKGSIGQVKVYYEVNTGFLVGHSGRTATSEVEIVLSATNADIPTLN